jgi:hypothetical protein
MRIAAFVSVIALAAGGSLSAGQERAGEPHPPKSGDTIIVKGCLRGQALEAAEPAPQRPDVIFQSGLTFQLKGKKDLLKALVEKHDGRTVELTGVLKSRIDAGARGRQFGRTRIVVGVQSTGERGVLPPPDEPMPVLEVKSFEGDGVSCVR